MSIIKDILNELDNGSYNETYDPMSYQTVLKDLTNFRQAGGTYSSDFNQFDMPGNKFFRIMFHFYNTDSDFAGGYGLLHPTWIETDKMTNQGDWVDPTIEGRAQELKYWRYTTAYSYLMQNNEEERAGYLKQFINLLSNISAYSPWYFQSVNGLDEALDRITPGEMKVKEQRHITINCLEDSVDNRIGTLMDLYRTITWSWRTKRFIIPENLRKFDMTIAIIQSPIKELHHPTDSVKITDALGMVGEWLNSDDTSEYATFDVSHASSQYLTSYKMLEFHNCEFDYNSAKTGYETIDNTSGFKQEYKLDILYDSVTEYSYNEFLNGIGEMGDLIGTDSKSIDYNDSNLDTTTESQQPNPADNQSNAIKTNQDTRLSQRLDSSSNLVTQVLGSMFSHTSTKVDNLIIGNLFGFSLEKTAQALGYALDNNLLSVITRAVEDSNSFNGLHYVDKIGNIYSDDEQKNKATAIQNSQSLGNIYEAATVIRNTV